MNDEIDWTHPSICETPDEGDSGVENQEEDGTMKYSDLPAIGTDLEGGTFAGLITLKDGMHCAVVLLPGHASKINWENAMQWAATQGGSLPPRPVAALLFSNLRNTLKAEWHWTSDAYEGEASYAWGCNFDYGFQFGGPKSYEGSAVAVRLIPLTA